MTEISQTEKTYIQTYWDPLFVSLPIGKVEECQRNNRKFTDKLDFYQQYPNYIRINIFLLFLLALLIMIIYFYIDSKNVNWNDTEGVIEFMIFLPFAFTVTLFPMLIYRSYIRSFERPLTNLLIARKYGWLYNPNHFEEQWDLLVKKYPEIFREADITKEYNYQQECAE